MNYTNFYIRTLKFLFVSLTFALIACSSGTVSNQSSATAEQNCTRSIAQPIIKKTIYPNSTFLLQPDERTAFETVVFDNGDKLIIHNYGCEKYMLTFRFQTGRFQNDTSNVLFWYKRAVSLMSEVLPGIDAPIDISSGINRLVNQIENEAPNGFEGLKIGEQLNVGDSLSSALVAVDRVQQLTDNEFAVEVTFVRGPLL